MNSVTAAAIKALGVVVKAPHIATYLAKYDPQAYMQVREAFYGFSEIELAAAVSPSFARDVDPCAHCGEDFFSHVNGACQSRQGYHFQTRRKQDGAKQ